MTSLFNKLNLGDHRDILVLNPPLTFEPEIADLEGVTVHRSTDSISKVTFSLAFAERQDHLDEMVRSVVKKAEGDAILWFAYPKASSKRYSCDFHRDTGFSLLESLGFKGVRQVSIDSDWSALRFRRAQYVGSKSS